VEISSESQTMFGPATKSNINSRGIVDLSAENPYIALLLSGVGTPALLLAAVTRFESLPCIPTGDSSAEHWPGG